MNPPTIHEWIDLIRNGTQVFPPTEIALKLGITLAIGLLIGFERQWSQKDYGVRTFSLTALLGVLSTMVSPAITVTAMVGVLLLVVLMNTRTLLADRALEGTTSVTLIVTFVLGTLVGTGHTFTPVTAAIVTTMLLSLKPEFTRFTGGLRPEEIRSALILGMLGFVIWPLLPNRYLDPWRLLQPRHAWITVLVVACLGFVNYVLLRLYGSRGVSLTAFFGGLISSKAAVTELCTSLANAGLLGQLFAAVELTSVAMYLRNLLILLIFARSTLLVAALPLLGMTGVALHFARRNDGDPEEGQVKLALSSPISLRKVGTFAGLFLGIEIFGVLATRLVGHAGLSVVSALGGLVSSASATAAAATLVLGGRVAPEQAAIASVVAALVSTLVSLFLVRRQTRDAHTTRKLLVATTMQTAAGIGLLVISIVIFHLHLGERYFSRVRVH